jgi:hypothetical protein
MRLLVAVAVSTLALLMPAAVFASARHETVPVTFPVFNPCTGEQVQVTTTNHYLVFQHGDLTHSSNGKGVGLTSGNEYVYVRRGYETGVHGFFEVIHLISLGSGSDMTLTDDMGDVEDPVITCS